MVLTTGSTLLADEQIVTLPDRDYRYRLIAPKVTWTTVVAELAQEQEWSNFKSEVARYQGAADSGYVHALHEVWNVMYTFQEKEPPAARRSSGRSFGKDG